MRKLTEFHECECASACGQVAWESKEIEESRSKKKMIRVMKCYPHNECKNCEKDKENRLYECVCMVFRAKWKKHKSDVYDWETHDVDGYLEYDADYNYDCKCVSTRLLIEKGSEDDSKGKYKISDDDKLEQVHLGENDIKIDEKVHAGHTFEILYPAGPVDCPYKIKQYFQTTEIKHELKNGVWIGVENEMPEGGFGSDKWQEDSNASGKHVSEMFPGSFAKEKTYIDNPGPVYKDKRELPYSYKSRFKIELRDCHNKLVDCIKFDLFIEIDEDGKVIKNEMTLPVPCQ